MRISARFLGSRYGNRQRYGIVPRGCIGRVPSVRTDYLLHTGVIVAGYMCPHCGKVFTDHCELIPTHNYPEPCRSVCPGSKQHPRNPETDKRPLWKDEEDIKAVCVSHQSVAESCSSVIVIDDPRKDLITDDHVQAQQWYFEMLKSREPVKWEPMQDARPNPECTQQRYRVPTCPFCGRRFDHWGPVPNHNYKPVVAQRPGMIVQAYCPGSGQPPQYEMLPMTTTGSLEPDIFSGLSPIADLVKLHLDKFATTLAAEHGVPEHVVFCPARSHADDPQPIVVGPAVK